MRKRLSMGGSTYPLVYHLASVASNSLWKRVCKRGMSTLALLDSHTLQILPRSGGRRYRTEHASAGMNCTPPRAPALLAKLAGYVYSCIVIPQCPPFGMNTLVDDHIACESPVDTSA